MKWINHQIVTGVAMYAMTDDLLLTFAGVVGSVIPDKIEGNPFQKRHFWQWHMTHRGWSHCPSIYLGIMALVYIYASQGVLVSNNTLLMRDMVLAFLTGCLFHIVEDAFCGKVPLVTPAYKVGVKLFKVGTAMEYLFSILCVLVIYVITTF